MAKTSLEPAHIPALRRLARGLTGSQGEADELVLKSISRNSKGASGAASSKREAIRALCEIVSRRDGEYGDALQNDERSEPEEPCSAMGLSVAEAVPRVPLEERICLLLVVLERMTYDEVAEVRSVDVDTVRRRVAEARRRIQMLTLREQIEVKRAN